MTSLASNARVAWYAIVSGANDYWSIFTLKSWIFGWCVRMISQVSFFALIGKLLRSDQQTQFLLIGNAVVIAAAGAFLVLAGWLGFSTAHAEGRCQPGIVIQSCPPPPLDAGRTRHGDGVHWLHPLRVSIRGRIAARSVPAA